MTIGGIQKLTLIDYPDKLAATVFLSGCNFRCPFCYSPELVLPERIKKHPKISEAEFFEFLSSRKDLLDGVVICGGEPCLNKDLPYFIKKIKDEGFKVKLDTNGSNPELLKDLLSANLLDYIAMDIKGAPGKKYEKIIGRKIDVRKIKESVEIIKNSGIGYEFRTTVVPGLHTKSDIIEIGKWLNGADKYYLQNFRPEKTLNQKFELVEPYPQKFMLEIVKAVSPFFGTCLLR